MKRAALIFCILLFFLYSCQRKKGESVFIPSTELHPLTLGMLPTLDGLPFHIAKAQGIYDSLGLDLTILSFNSAYDRDAAFQFKSMDGMITDYPSAVTLQAIHHTDLGIILKHDGYFCFIVSKESGINQLQELKEKNIAVSHNTIIEYATGQLLNKAGISQAEVNKPEIAQLPLRLQMLQYDQIDASFLPDPAASIAMNARHRSLISTQELGIDFTVTAFSREAINENLTGLIALPVYRKAERPSADALDKAVTWLKTNNRISQTYSGYKNLIDTTFTKTNSTTIK